MKFVLLDQLENPLASGSADLTEYNFWEGIIEKHVLPPDLMALCLEVHEHLSNQVFHAVERVQALVNEYNLNVRLDDGRFMRAIDLMMNEDFIVSWKNDPACQPLDGV